jgi:hypothetical protein
MAQTWLADGIPRLDIFPASQKGFKKKKDTALKIQEKTDRQTRDRALEFLPFEAIGRNTDCLADTHTQQYFRGKNSGRRMRGSYN